MNLDNVLLATFPLDMNYAGCGLPFCCPGDQPKFVQVQFFPSNLQALQLEEQVTQFMQEADEIYHSTGMPMCPCMICHFCIPFSPVCAMIICAQRRKSKLDQLVKDYNEKSE